MSNRPLRTVAAGLGGVAVAAGATLRWAYDSARDVPLSPLHGDRYIGPTWPDREGLCGDSVPGEMDSLADYARPGFDPDAVHPDVRDFYERTADFEMTLTATWHHPFRFGARFASRWTSRVEQLNLPAPGSGSKRVSSDLFALADPAATTDPRDDPRVWIRSDDDTGAGVFVAIYASHTAHGERFVNVAVPLPGASLATVLRIHNDGGGIELTTDCPDGGLYLHTDAGAFTLPASQRFRVSPAHDPTAPAPPDGVSPAETEIIADQRIRLCGLPLVTIRYAATRRREE